MTKADRALAGAGLIALLFGTWLAVPLALTVFPAVFERIARGSSDALVFCNGVLASVHNELPPLGLVTLGLAAAALGSLIVRLVRAGFAARRTVGATPARLQRAAARAGIAGRVSCVDDLAPFAYCAGLARPHIYLSLGAVRALRSRELEAVLLHEAHHLRRHDPLRAFMGRALASVFFAVPVVHELFDRFEIAKELEADRAVLAAQGTPRNLAGAMLVLARPEVVSRLGPISAWSVSAARIDQLAGAGMERLLPGISRRALTVTAASLLIASMLGVGQAARAHLFELSFLPEAAGALAHVCPLPIRGPLI